MVTTVIQIEKVMVVQCATMLPWMHPQTADVPATIDTGQIALNLHMLASPDKE